MGKYLIRITSNWRGSWYWQLINRNGLVLSTSYPYASKTTALTRAKRIAEDLGLEFEEVRKESQ